MKWAKFQERRGFQRILSQRFIEEPLLYTLRLLLCRKLKKNQQQQQQKQPTKTNSTSKLYVND